LKDARAQTPVPPKTRAYLPVEDLPPDREMMTSDQQSKLKKELSGARDRQAAAAKAQGGGMQAVQPTNQAVRQ
jgi:hypothetical protein